MSVAVTRNGPNVLLALVGLLYLWIGFVAHGWDRPLGLAGGLAIIAAAVAIGRSTTGGMALLVVGALPLAITTWWSAVTPALATLVLLVGVLAIRTRGEGGEKRTVSGSIRWWA